MKKSDVSAVRTDDEGLEFPDRSGMDDDSNRVDIDTAFQLCERYARLFGAAADERPPGYEKCAIEFTL